MTGLLAYVVFREGGEVPWWAWLALAIGGLVGAGLVWDLAGKAQRAMLGRTPVVEVSRLPVGPEGASLRIVDAHPRPLTGLTVLLVAGAAKIERVHSGPGVTGVRAAYRISGEVKHERTLLALAEHDLRGVDVVDRTVDVHIPPEAMQQPWMWRVAVLQHVRRGPPRQHWYPVHVCGAAWTGIPRPEF